MEVAFCPQRQPRSMSREAYRELYRRVRVARRDCRDMTARKIEALKLCANPAIRARMICEMVNPPLVIFGGPGV